MSIKIGTFAIWRSKKEAKGFGATHHARIWGIIPGFVAMGPDGQVMWIPRSDFLNFVEDVLNGIAILVSKSLNIDMTTEFTITSEIE